MLKALHSLIMVLLKLAVYNLETAYNSSQIYLYFNTHLLSHTVLSTSVNFICLKY